MSNTNSPVKNSPVYIDGPAGQLEALWAPAAPSTTNSCALLCHPHPEYGGSMHDSVLAIAAEVLSAHGFSHLRFNFRGVGDSAGGYDNGQGERDDIAAAWQWLANQSSDANTANHWSKMILVGYSFGAATAWAARAGCAGLTRLVLIAPPSKGMTFEGNAGQVPTQVIVGGRDSYCDLAALPSGATSEVIDGADHFFSGAGQALADAIGSSL